MIALARYRVHFQARETVSLPAYSGSAWRGALGHALKRAVCVTRQPDCGACVLLRSCAYPYVFETPPPPDAEKMRLYRAAPHPFVLDVDARSGSLAADEHTALGLTLVGRANRFLPYLVYALEQAAAQGIGRGRGTLALVAVEEERSPGCGEWQPLYEPGGVLAVHGSGPAQAPALRSGPLRVTLPVPMRLQADGRNVRPEAFRFRDLFASLLRRLSMLTYFHTDTPLEADFAGLVAESERVALCATDLCWRDWTRYSARQRTAMQMGGIEGSFAVDLSEHPALWPYLWLGQWVHTGKGTSMGLGRYRVGPASLPEAGNGAG